MRSCRQFEGSQITPGQAHAPKGRAKVDINQHGDGRLELLYRGQLLVQVHMVHEHLRHGWPMTRPSTSVSMR